MRWRVFLVLVLATSAVAEDASAEQRDTASAEQRDASAEQRDAASAEQRDAASAERDSAEQIDSASAEQTDSVEPAEKVSADGALAALELGTFRVESASPGGRRLGVGLELGWATALQAKLMLRPEHSVRASVGAFSGLAFTEPSASLSVDYLYHPLTLARGPAFTLHTHVGGGGTVVVMPAPGKRTTLPAALYYRAPTQLWTGLRAPVGVDLALKDVPVDITLDVVPTLLTFPGVGVGVGATLGARWWL